MIDETNERETKNEFDVNVITSNIDVIAKDVQKKLLNTWLDKYSHRLQTLKSLLLSVEKHHNEFNDVSYEQILSKIRIPLHSALMWVADVKKDLENSVYSEENIASMCNMLIKDNSLGDFVEIPISDEELVQNDEDDIKSKLWKRLTRYRLLNRKRLRVVKVDPFIERNILIPLVLNSWEIAQARLQKFCKLLQGMLSIIKWNKDNVLELKHNQDVEKEFAESDIVDVLQTTLEEVNELQKNLVKIDPNWDDWWGVLIGDVKQNWNNADTFLYPKKLLSYKSVKKERNRVHSKIKLQLSHWNQYLESFCDDAKKDLELSVLQFNLRKLSISIINDVNKQVDSQVIPKFSAIREKIENAFGRLVVLDKEEEDPSDEIQENYRELILSLKKRLLPDTMDLLLEIRINNEMEKFANEVYSNIQNLSNKHIIKRKEYTTSVPPRSFTEAIPLKEIIINEFYADLLNNHNPLLEEIDDSMNKITRQTSSLDQILEFNLDAGLNLRHRDPPIDNLREEFNKILIEGVQRTKTQVEDVLEVIEYIKSSVEKSIDGNISDFNQRIQNLEDNEKVLALKIQIARTQAKARMKEIFYSMLRFLRTLLPHIIGFLRNAYSRYHTRILRLKKMTGFSASQVQIERELSQFLADTKEKIRSLPYVYQRLFRLEPIDDERFFTGHEREFELLRSEYQRWQMERIGLTAVVGEKGGGKTTLINFAIQQIYKNIKVKSLVFSTTLTAPEELLKQIACAIDLENIHTFEELNDVLLSGESLVFVIEGFDRLYLRTVDGFYAFETMLRLIASTCSKVHWVISCSLYGWQYLEKLYNLNFMFRKVITLGPISEDKLYDLIMRRHQVSGFDLRYIPTSEIESNRKYKKLKDTRRQQDYIKTQFFKILSTLSAGNISSALLFWQRAIERVSSDMIEINVLTDFDYSFLMQLPIGELFTLGALIQHGGLTAQQYSLIFRESEDQSIRRLESMCAMGLLTILKEGYYIHPVLYRPAVKALKGKNIL